MHAIFLRFLSRGPRRRLSAEGKRRGQTLVEYSLIICVIALVAIAVLVSLGDQTRNLYSVINSRVASAPGAAAST